MMTEDEEEVDENTTRIDARGNMGEQTNINVEGDFVQKTDAAPPEEIRQLFQEELERLFGVDFENLKAALDRSTKNSDTLEADDQGTTVGDGEYDFVGWSIDFNSAIEDGILEPEKIKRLKELLDDKVERKFDVEPEFDFYEKALLGHAAAIAGEKTVARDYLREAFAGFEELGDDRAAGQALYDIGISLIGESRHEEAVVALKNARKKFHAVNDKWMTSMVTADIGGSRAMSGKRNEAKKIYRKVRKDKHSPEAVIKALNGLSLMAEEDGDFLEAIRLNRKVIYTLESYPHNISVEGRGWLDMVMIAAMTNLAIFYKGLQDYSQAIEFSGQARELAIKIDNPRSIMETQINYASVLIGQGNPADYALADELLQQALETAEIMNDFRGRCYARLGLSQMALGLGELDRMEELCAMVIALAEKGEDPKITGGVYNNMAISYAENGRKEAAEVMFMKSIEKARGGGLRADEFRFLWNASKFFAGEGNYEKVSELREQAHRLYSNSPFFDQWPWSDSN